MVLSTLRRNVVNPSPRMRLHTSDSGRRPAVLASSHSSACGYYEAKPPAKLSCLTHNSKSNPEIVNTLDTLWPGGAYTSSCVIEFESIERPPNRKRTSTSSPFIPPVARSPARPPEKRTATKIFSPFFPSECSLTKYGAVIGISRVGLGFSGGLRFFLTFPLLDVPYISMGLCQGVRFHMGTSMRN